MKPRKTPGGVPKPQDIVARVKVPFDFKYPKDMYASKYGIEETLEEILKAEDKYAIETLEGILSKSLTNKWVPNNTIYLMSHKTYHELRKELEKKYRALNPKLQIPKWVAEIAEDNRNVYSYGRFDPCKKIDEWIWEEGGKVKRPEFREDVIKAYINPLTRKFVEVEENDKN